ncbi:DUF3278 domain-containing protein [Pradoshia sp. D12]|uniref:DUF3278 domain-containing protein n=1 Tax=Bacillaceae TaxID=186817 RepID=UPI00112A273B|nr:MULTISPECIES: DUF3278 domain-containing protein [Bacillaceae]QFK71975.1 DUF3278 domain-containing protein [Pradoshia sp. D12]TPF71533.1 DUF3278 domain-containing protein [Bacillus sp. D12]
MKSWISFLIPDDEYKEKRMLYFFAEGGILLFLFLVLIMFVNKYASIDLEIILLLAISIFVIYIFGRYIVAGIEYTEVATKIAYMKEMRVIFSKTVTFFVVFTVLYLILVDMPSSIRGWSELIGFTLFGGVVMFLTNYISLKRSYNKNKELL